MHSFYGTYLHLTQCVHLQRREHKCELSDMIDNRTPLWAFVCVSIQGLFQTQQRELCWQKGNLLCVWVEQSLFPCCTGYCWAQKTRSLFRRPPACITGILPVCINFFFLRIVNVEAIATLQGGIQSSLVLSSRMWLVKNSHTALHNLAKKFCSLTLCQQCWVRIQ